MTEQPKGGRPSLEDTHGEPTRTVKVIITQSQYDFAMRQPEGGISAFIRYAIDVTRYYRENLAEEGEKLDARMIRMAALRKRERTEDIQKPDNNREGG